MRGHNPWIAHRTEEGAGADPAEQTETAAPWSADLEERFQDPDQRAAVDEFLRSNVQPHVTQLEQRVAQTPEEAATLYQDFLQAPDETFFSVAEELYGAEVAEQLYQQLAQRANESTEAEEPEQPEAEEPEAPEVPEDVQYATAIVLRDQEERAFKEAVAEVDDELFPEPVRENAEVRERLLAPFVAVADGDMDAATEAYKEWAGLIDQGTATPEQAAEAAAEGITPDEVPDPLAGGTTPAVPQQTQTTDLGEAVDEWLAEQRAAKAPPPVGGV